MIPCCTKNCEMHCEWCTLHIDFCHIPFSGTGSNKRHFMIFFLNLTVKTNNVVLHLAKLGNVGKKLKNTGIEAGNGPHFQPQIDLQP